MSCFSLQMILTLSLVTAWSLLPTVLWLNVMSANYGFTFHVQKSAEPISPKILCVSHAETLNIQWENQIDRGQSKNVDRDSRWQFFRDIFWDYSCQFPSGEQLLVNFTFMTPVYRISRTMIVVSANANDWRIHVWDFFGGTMAAQMQIICCWNFKPIPIYLQEIVCVWMYFSSTVSPAVSLRMCTMSHKLVMLFKRHLKM